VSILNVFDWSYLVLKIIVSAAQLLSRNRPAEVVGWLTFVEQHPTTDHSVKARAKQVQARFANEAVNIPEAVPQVDHRRKLENVVTDAQTKLAVGAEEHSGVKQSRGKREEAERKTGAVSLVEALTDREEDVLKLLAQGLTNREIAAVLTIAVGTVKAHNHNIYGKLGVDNRVEAVTRARELDLI